MKKLIVCASALALAACGGEAEPEAVEEEAMVEEAAAESAVVAGTYEVTWPDGATSVTTINEDGTFTSTQGEETASGTVTDVDGKACFDSDGDEEGAMCWTGGEPAEDGSFSSTADDGTVVTVVPVMAEEEG